QCDLKTSHFAVTRAILYIQNASSATDSTRKQQALESAQRSLLEALQQGQETSVAAWYYLGSYYYLANDVAGADSAFDRVEVMAPSCLSDTEQYRQAMWARVANQGIEGLRDGDLERAKDRFAFANAVYAKDPTTYFYLGTVFATEDNADSALVYFREAAQRAVGDTAFAEIREKSVQNLARIYEVVENWDSATAYFRSYQQIRPDDSEATLGLARALTASGDTAGAEAVYDGILANPASTEPTDLFRIGVALFRSDRPAKAARAFEAGLERAPLHRNGLFNLTNAYFSMAQAASGESARTHATAMLGTARRLLDIDPASAQIMRLMAAGYQLRGQGDSTDIWLRRADNLPFDVDIQAAQAIEGGFYVAGSITAAAPGALTAVQDSLGRDSTRLESLRQQLRGGSIPAAQRQQAQQRQTTLERRVNDLRTRMDRLKAPVAVPALVFEFLDAQGQVITSETVAAQSAEPRARKQFELRPTGEGIVAFRYRTS
ncbi:MAG TPA: tetratricopeptide repeat protein, partial [Gemmatimonadales bacterium]|nr:tetratricopeptide repeat protein [Gemmatimonadales bacterium]